MSDQPTPHYRINCVGGGHAGSKHRAACYVLVEPDYEAGMRMVVGYREDIDLPNVKRIVDAANDAGIGVDDATK